jgi:uncharacterized protein YheU (UPF0270 family)
MWFSDAYQENRMVGMNSINSEQGVIVPYDQINPETLTKMIEEFVTREWSSLSDDGFSLGQKVEQVLEQLKQGKVKVVFDFETLTTNIKADV